MLQADDFQESCDKMELSREDIHRVSLLDETIVVKHINESAITKDYESFHLCDKSLDENFIQKLQQEQIMMFDASKLD